MASPAFVADYGHTRRAGAPTVVLVHGAGMDHTVWTLQGRYLAFHGWNVLGVDLPGHGRSRALLALPSIDAIADWLAELIAEYGDEPAALVGHSMGALARAGHGGPPSGPGGSPVSVWALPRACRSIPSCCAWPRRTIP